jgi:hypothetical protein
MCARDRRVAEASDVEHCLSGNGVVVMGRGHGPWPHGGNG